MAYVSNATKRTLQDIASKIGMERYQDANVIVLRSEIYNYITQQKIPNTRIDNLIQYTDSHHQQLGQEAMQQIGDKQQSSQSNDQSQKQLDAITMRSIAYDILSDQQRVQQQTKFMTNYAVGVGDPSLIAITNVNAQIAAGIYNYRDIQPFDNLNALNDQPSHDTGTRVEPMNQKMQRQVILEQGNEKEKEQVYQQDKDQMTIKEIQELLDDVITGVIPDPPIYGPQPTEQPQIASLGNELQAWINGLGQKSSQCSSISFKGYKHENQ
ncbi:MAG: hypothetical protein EZS28_033667 [Streblomastix strix]|uniref:Uncharacterized protein n=1 Tax=Streblomastix strix TaxID=222440 RepID=A0A5J4UJ44_9EUKA|nr:MAG: hypothetical protein EZS28_033667 [Streblomastix strix]